MVVELFDKDLDEIMECEALAFPKALQASRELYQKRFDLNHVMLGYREQMLLGVISFSYGIFDPDQPFTIPGDFYQWSTQDVPPDYDTAFVYNLGLVPGARGSRVIRELIYGAFRRMTNDGCRQLVAEGPVPSYAGRGHLPAIPAIRESLDDFVKNGTLPSEELLFKDPHLSLYRRISPCSILRIMPQFLPADEASGGFRVMLFKELYRDIKKDVNNSRADKFHTSRTLVAE